jgi:hypothetical protein
VLAWLEEGKDVRFGEWNLREVDLLNTWWAFVFVCGGVCVCCCVCVVVCLLFMFTCVCKGGLMTQAPLHSE